MLERAIDPFLTAPHRGKRDSGMTTGRNWAFGAGCGAVSALLFAVISTGSPLAFLLYLIAPLPILIATLGFGHHAGLVATVVSLAVTALIFSPMAGIIQALSIGLPSWFTAYLLLLGRSSEANETEKMEWYPLGRVLFWIIGLSVALTLSGALLIATDYASFIATFSRAVDVVLTYDPDLVAGLSPEDKAKFVETLSALLANIAAPISTSASVIISVILLWAAGRIVQASGRLPRPWPDLSTLALPRLAVPALVLSLALAIAADDYPALAGRISLAGLITGYCLQGLAVLHAITRPLKSRRGLLFAIYLVFVLLPGWPVIGIALLGIADMWLSFRTRFSTAPLPSNTAS